MILMKLLGVDDVTARGYKVTERILNICINYANWGHRNRWIYLFVVIVDVVCIVFTVMLMCVVVKYVKRIITC